jgi:hypothetical protein
MPYFFDVVDYDKLRNEDLIVYIDQSGKEKTSAAKTCFLKAASTDQPVSKGQNVYSFNEYILVLVKNFIGFCHCERSEAISKLSVNQEIASSLRSSQ